jgi:hypothetical protein
MFPICATKVNCKLGVIIAAACAAASTAALAQAPFSTTLELDVENIVSYGSDVFDAPKFASDRTSLRPHQSEIFSSSWPWGTSWL